MSVHLVRFKRIASIGAALAGATALLASALGASAHNASMQREATAAVLVPEVGPIHWHPCGATFDCARVHVPMDYDYAAGAQISLAVIRIPASDSAHRIGSLFVNPGGPGNSGVDFVRQDALDVLPAAAHRRFDIVGFDPRGVKRSTPLRCFSSTDEQQTFFAHVPAFPVGTAQERRYAAKMEALGARCAALNPALIDHLSTANVARDMDLLREAVGDPTLSYAGFSYGSHLGETYANMFPGRVRAMELDGILDSVAWTTGHGDRSFQVPFSLRVGSARATSSALGFFLRKCQQAGPEDCAFASDDTTAKFGVLMKRVRHKAVVIDAGQGAQRFTYADIVDGLRGGLTFPPIWGEVGQLLQAAYQATRNDTSLSVPADPTGAAPYDNSQEALLAVACGETDNPTDPGRWPGMAALADLRSPYFGSDWTFISQACATWPGADTDRYTGPFNRQSAAPALLINARFDAAGLYQRARVVADRMPGARLLTLDGAGHPASFTGNPCIDKAVADYLIKGALPEDGATCATPGNPFGS